jgi:FAD synthase
MVCNIGVRPTVDGEQLTIEAHIFGFEKKHLRPRHFIVFGTVFEK